MRNPLHTLREEGSEDREVEVTPEGEVREIEPEPPEETEEADRERKPTKLAKRTFGRTSG